MRISWGKQACCLSCLCVCPRLWFSECVGERVFVFVYVCERERKKKYWRRKEMEAHTLAADWPTLYSSWLRPTLHITCSSSAASMPSTSSKERYNRRRVKVETLESRAGLDEPLSYPLNTIYYPFNTTLIPFNTTLIPFITILLPLSYIFNAFITTSERLCSILWHKDSVRIANSCMSP